MVDESKRNVGRGSFRSLPIFFSITAFDAFVERCVARFYCRNLLTFPFVNIIRCRITFGLAPNFL